MVTTDSRGRTPPTFPMPHGPRWNTARPFVFVGTSAVLAGGVVAAVTGPTGFDAGSWVAAYLVLVCGVSQLALGAGLAVLPGTPPAGSAVLAQLLVWNAGCAAVVLGTLVEVPVVTSLGGLALVVVLARALRAVGPGRPEVSGWVLLFRTLCWFVLVSVPVGLLLAWLRHG